MNAKLKADLAKVSAFVNQSRSKPLPVDRIIEVFDAACIDDLPEHIVENAFEQWSKLSIAAERQRLYATVERACWRIARCSCRP